MAREKSTKTHVIDVEPRLRHLLPKYLKGRKKDLTDLANALTKNDFDFIKITSHTIKGHAASYGFKKLTDICRKIEKAAQEKDIDLIAALLKEYDEYIENVELPRLK